MKLFISFDPVQFPSNWIVKLSSANHDLLVVAHNTITNNTVVKFFNDEHDASKFIELLSEKQDGEY